MVNLVEICPEGVTKAGALWASEEQSRKVWRRLARYQWKVKGPGRGSPPSSRLAGLRRVHPDALRQAKRRTRPVVDWTWEAALGAASALV
jgi:hypothetical protein